MVILIFLIFRVGCPPSPLHPIFDTLVNSIELCIVKLIKSSSSFRASTFFFLLLCLPVSFPGHPKVYSLSDLVQKSPFSCRCLIVHASPTDRGHPILISKLLFCISLCLVFVSVLRPCYRLMVQRCCTIFFIRVPNIYFRILSSVASVSVAVRYF